MSRLLVDPEKAVIIALASVVLHNMLRTHSKDFYTPEGYIDIEDEAGNIKAGLWRESTVDFVRSLPKGKTNHAKKSAEQVRATFAEYFISDDAAPWRWNMI